jgi:hypothetical protein
MKNLMNLVNLLINGKRVISVIVAKAKMVEITRG